jgi:hypothetical protein
MTTFDAFLIGLNLGLVAGWLMTRRQRFYDDYRRRRGEGLR